MGELAAVVEKPRADAAIGALRVEGVYDDSRSVYECGSETVAIPVTEPPEETPVREVIEEAGEPRLQSLEDHLREAGWSESELDQAPGSWAVIGTVILVDVSDCPRPEDVGEALLAMHGQADTVLARQGISGRHREPAVEVIAGAGDTETVHQEHGTTYAMDLSEVMFSPGNKAERARMGDVTGSGERVLDMFAGIGYFTLPMARAGAHVTAVEHSPTTFAYLVENVVRNGVQESVETYRADCRDVIAEAEGFEFDRIVMGYYDAYEYLDSAFAALGPNGTIHMHEATPEELVPDRPERRLREAAGRAERSVAKLDTRTVKGYSEGVSHIVVDADIE
ncbi:methyltransferase domain-containing protein [Halovenus sp. WSH3]|uniref:Methyltransferase domain-containing protein n=1 Tax=Halovenus carboxidivorans TaxID=2692199 RepID=A0A6B0T226_9EURY|nr:class I SAM-dependent methyltransferase family protein [Halovenus carboxidivorans]MXR52288.1 methyltransferase domain-containing protein [Halovenus carboxidivorans]